MRNDYTCKVASRQTSAVTKNDSTFLCKTQYNFWILNLLRFRYDEDPDRLLYSLTLHRPGRGSGK
jgi:hypothetical protein